MVDVAGFIWNLEKQEKQSILKINLKNLEKFYFFGVFMHSSEYFWNFIDFLLYSNMEVGSHFSILCYFLVNCVGRMESINVAGVVQSH